MSTALMILKIGLNGTGFLVSYISAEPKYISGVLIGVALILASIMIPEEWKNRKRGK